MCSEGNKCMVAGFAIEGDWVEFNLVNIGWHVIEAFRSPCFYPMNKFYICMRYHVSLQGPWKLLSFFLLITFKPGLLKWLSMVS